MGRQTNVLTDRQKGRQKDGSIKRQEKANRESIQENHSTNRHIDQQTGEQID